MNRGTTYSAKMATRIAAPTAIRIIGSFDFFTGAATPWPCDEARAVGWWAWNCSMPCAACVEADGAAAGNDPAPAFFQVHSVLSPMAEGASASRSTVPTSSCTAWAADSDTGFPSAAGAGPAPEASPAEAGAACPQFAQNLAPSASFAPHSPQYAMSSSSHMFRPRQAQAKRLPYRLFTTSGAT